MSWNDPELCCVQNLIAVSCCLGSCKVSQFKFYISRVSEMSVIVCECRRREVRCTRVPAVGLEGRAFKRGFSGAGADAGAGAGARAG